MTLRTLASGAVLALAISGCGSAAHAAARLFTLSGEPVGDISWQMDSRPTPDQAGSLSAKFFNIALDVGGAGTTGAITIYSASDGGGLDVGLPSALFVTQGPEVYSGSLGSPRFGPGHFALQDYYTGASDTLTIAAVPEPPSWATLLAGVFFLGAGLRRHRRSTSTWRISQPQVAGMSGA
jgi:hypothetical protein